MIQFTTNSNVCMIFAFHQLNAVENQSIADYSCVTFSTLWYPAASQNCHIWSSVQGDLVGGIDVCGRLNFRPQITSGSQCRGSGWWCCPVNINECRPQLKWKGVGDEGINNPVARKVECGHRAWKFTSESRFAHFHCSPFEFTVRKIIQFISLIRRHLPPFTGFTLPSHRQIILILLLLPCFKAYVTNAISSCTIWHLQLHSFLYLTIIPGMYGIK